MTSEQLELASLRREVAWLMQSDAVKSMAEKDENGKHKYNIKGLDDCIQTLHARARKAEARLKEVETEAQLLRAENINLRRRIEALADPPSCEYHEPHPQDADPDDERRFPLFG